MTNLSKRNSEYLQIRADKISLIFILFVPIINSLADVTIYYFQSDDAKGIHPGIVRGIFMLCFACFVLFTKLKKTLPNQVILLYIIYLFILILFSSNFQVSFMQGYIKWFVAFLMFPAGYYYITSFSRLKKLNISMIFAAIIISLNYLIAQYTKLGISAYSEDSFYLGGAGVGISNQLSLIVLFSIFLYYDRKNLNLSVKTIFTIVILFSIILIVIAMKRAAIFGLILGFLTYSFFCPRKQKLFKYTLILTLFFIIIFPLFEKIITERYQARVDKLEGREELREKELKFVWIEMKDASIFQVLFGKEAFNSRQFFGPKYFGKDRMIHGDFASFVYGTGILGIIIYLAIFVILIIYNHRLQKSLGNIPIYAELTAIFYGIIACTFLISMTGSGSIGERSMVYLYLGGISGVKHTAILLRKSLSKKSELMISS